MSARVYDVGFHCHSARVERCQACNCKLRLQQAACLVRLGENEPPRIALCDSCALAIVWALELIHPNLVANAPARAAVALAGRVLAHEVDSDPPDPDGEAEVIVYGDIWKRWLKLTRQAVAAPSKKPRRKSHA